MLLCFARDSGGHPPRQPYLIPVLTPFDIGVLAFAHFFAPFPYLAFGLQTLKGAIPLGPGQIARVIRANRARKAVEPSPGLNLKTFTAVHLS